MTGTASPEGSAVPEPHSEHDVLTPARIRVLAIAALGVVFGDIGTSPLYAVNECFGVHGVRATHGNVLGVLSLFFWSLVMVIVVKYLTFIMRADNHGEGGILALLALHKEGTQNSSKKVGALVLLGLFGAALLYGDGMITPAISVLSAYEGLEVATPALKSYIIPLTVGTLVALFAVQRKGTAGIGAVFGPGTGIWFVAIIAAGLPWIIRQPAILGALNPLHGARFFLENGFHGFRVLGSVVLCITGGEALYADMGHFGRRPIRLAWYGLVLPALLINYFGQGAYLFAHPEFEPGGNVFFSLVQEWGRGGIYVMVAIATFATVVASQALISGAYSLTQQAMQLGYWPRVTITHTSKDQEGQIYCPEINWILMMACIALVIGFRRSTNLAAAYGIAVTGTMSITSVLFYAVARRRWGWPFWKAGTLLVLFLVLDLAFFAANALKLLDGGYVPAAIALFIFAIMTTWQMGRHAVLKRLMGKEEGMTVMDVLHNVMTEPDLVRTPRTTVFMVSNARTSAHLMLHYLKHFGGLPRRVVLLTVNFTRRPEEPADEQICDIKEVGNGVWWIQAACGFMQMPDVPKLLELAKVTYVLPLDLPSVSYVLGRETVIEGGQSELAWWRRTLFRGLAVASRPAYLLFNLPPGQVLELGAQVKL